MAELLVPLLGLAPDSEPTTRGVLTACMGAVPSLRGMKGAPTPASAGMATLTATCQGAALLTKLDGTNRIFAGTAKKLYEAGSSTWSDVSRAATYTGGATARWRFAQQEDVSFAANGADTIQASVSSGAFSCVAGAPVAAIVETVGKFVFALNTSTATNEIRWSALGDYTDWTASSATQAGNDTLEETPGGITAARRFGNSIAVFKKNSMYVGVYAEPPNVWTFSLIPGGKAGALSQEVVIDIGTPESPKLIFMGEDNFYLYSGAFPVPIGTNRVKESVFGSLLQARYYACTALHDPKNSLVYFYYPTTDTTIPDSCVVYNYKTDRWGRDDRSVEATLQFVSPALTYSGVGALYSTYVAFPALGYGIAFAGATQEFPAVFTTTHELKTLTGAAGSTSITTGDLGDDHYFTMALAVWPRFITEPTTAMMTHYYKNRSGAELTTGNSASYDDDGKFDALVDARWHRFQFTFSGDWEMSAIRPEWEKSGEA